MIAGKFNYKINGVKLKTMEDYDDLFNDDYHGKSRFAFSDNKKLRQYLIKKRGEIKPFVIEISKFITMNLLICELEYDFETGITEIEAYRAIPAIINENALTVKSEDSADVQPDKLWARSSPEEILKDIENTTKSLTPYMMDIISSKENPESEYITIMKHSSVGATCILAENTLKQLRYYQTFEGLADAKKTGIEALFKSFMSRRDYKKHQRFLRKIRFHKWIKRILKWN
jgi:hypothetical protein